MKLHLCIPTSVFVLFFSSCAQLPKGTTEHPRQVKRAVLDNGLTVLVAETPGSSQAAVTVRVKVGFFNEPDELSGLSHLLEHMYFKGTKRRPGPEDVANETKAIGGSLNAWTFNEETVYHVTLPVEHVEKAIDIHADALLEPLINEAQLKKEIEVVLQEGRRRADTPTTFAWEKMKGTAFEQHRVKRWLIGSDEGLRQLSREKVLEFHARYYKPSNMIVSIAGGIQASKAFALIKKYYGHAPDGAVKRDSGPSESAQTKLRYGQLTGDIKIPLSFMTFHTVPRGHADELPLDILATLLGSGRGARLTLDLQQKKRWVTGIRVRHNTTGELGWMEFFFEAGDRKHFDDSVAGVLAHLQDIQLYGLKPGEIERAKTLLSQQWVAGQEEPVELATQLAEAEHFNSLDLFLRFPEYLENITAQRVVDVARKYFLSSRMTVFEYVPQSMRTNRNAKSYQAIVEAALRSPGIKLTTPVNTNATQAPSLKLLAHDDTKAKDEDAALSSAVLTPRQLPNGLRVILVPRRRLPMATVLFSVHGGRSHETEKNSGWTWLVSDLLTRGSRGTTSDQFAIQMETLGASVGSFTNTDDFGVSVQMLAHAWKQSLRETWATLIDPAFHANDVQAAKEKRVSSILASMDDGFMSSANLFRQTAFGGHPYRLPIQGMTDAVQAVSRERLMDWYKRFWRLDNVKVVVVGDLPENELMTTLSTLTTEHMATELPKEPGVAVWNEQGPAERIRVGNRAQTSLIVGFPGVSLSKNLKSVQTADLLAAMTGGLGGRFFARIRGQENLAYSVQSVNWTLPSGSAFLIYTGMSPENETRAMDSLMDEIQKVRDAGFTETEISRAKNYLKGQYRTSMESISGCALELLSQWNQGRNPVSVDEYTKSLDSISPEDLQIAVRDIFVGWKAKKGIFRGQAPSQGGSR